MKGSCEEFADAIVEYVDGELPEGEARLVAEHLAGCERCQQTAQALKHSLGLARVVWSDNLGECESAVSAAPAGRSRPRQFYAVAASILITASVLVLMVIGRHPQKPAVHFKEVERQITRAGSAAELLAATQIIARCEGTEAIVERQYQFIMKEYAGTPAAEGIRAQYGSRVGGTHND